MKKMTAMRGRVLWYIIRFAATAILVFGAAGCDDSNSDTPYNEQTYYGGTLNITSEQVWVRNYTTNKLSQAYEKFTENRNILVIDEYSERVGSGAIDGGILSLTVNKPDNLLPWDYLKEFFEIMAEGEGWDVNTAEDDVEGSFILPMTETDGYVLMREGISGTKDSISEETVYFVYVNRDCTITGEEKEYVRVLYTFNPFVLNLKQGWNTIWYKQTYTTYGKSRFEMDIKNPDLKWVLVSQTPTK